MPDCTPGDAPAARIAAVGESGALSLADGRTVVLAGIADASVLSGDSSDTAAMSDWLAANLVGRDVTIGEPQAVDRYGRLPAAVFADGVLVQAELVGSGRAVAYPPIPVCADQILEAETVARTRHRGIWAGSDVSVLAATPEQMTGRAGRFAVFEGSVVSVGNRRERSYVDFGERWSEDVTVEIGRQARSAFGGEVALAGLVGRTVRVRGVIGSRGGPMVDARWPGQIEVIGGDAPVSRRTEP